MCSSYSLLHAPTFCTLTCHQRIRTHHAHSHSRLLTDALFKLAPNLVVELLIKSMNNLQMPPGPVTEVMAPNGQIVSPQIRYFMDLLAYFTQPAPSSATPVGTPRAGAPGLGVGTAALMAGAAASRDKRKASEMSMPPGLGGAVGAGVRSADDGMVEPGVKRVKVEEQGEARKEEETEEMEGEAAARAGSKAGGAQKVTGQIKQGAMVLCFFGFFPSCHMLCFLSGFAFLLSVAGSNGFSWQCTPFRDIHGPAFSPPKQRMHIKLQHRNTLGKPGEHGMRTVTTNMAYNPTHQPITRIMQHSCWPNAPASASSPSHIQEQTHTHKHQPHTRVVHFTHAALPPPAHTNSITIRIWLAG